MAVMKKDSRNPVITTISDLIEACYKKNEYSLKFN